MHNLDAISTAAIVLSFMLSTVGSIWIAVIAFQKNLAWGFATILVPFAAFVFVCLHWDRAGKAAMCCFSSVALIIATYYLYPNFHEAYEARHCESQTDTKAAKPAAGTAHKATAIASSHAGNINSHSLEHTTSHSGKRHHK